MEMEREREREGETKRKSSVKSRVRKVEKERHTILLRWQRNAFFLSP